MRLMAIRKVRKLLLLSVVIIFFLITPFILHSISTHKSSTVSACTTSTLDQAKPLIGTAKHSELQAVVTKIQADNNYASDADCIYPETDYYIGISDSANAKISMQKLQQAITKVSGPTPYFKLTASDSRITDMQRQVSFLLLQAEQFRNGGTLH